MSFAGEIEAFNRKALKAANMVIRGTALDLSSSIIKRTPVKTGRLRGNWQTEINGFPISEINSTASQATAKNRQVINTAKIKDAIYFVNNLPYAGVIERGSSSQAPQGMVAVTISAFKKLVAKNARKNR